LNTCAKLNLGFDAKAGVEEAVNAMAIVYGQQRCVKNTRNEVFAIDYF